MKDAKKIKSLEIQGATNVAVNAINFLHDYAHRIGKNLNIDDLIDKIMLHFGHIPEIARICNEILYLLNNNIFEEICLAIINYLGELLSTIWDMPIQMDCWLVLLIGLYWLV